MTGKKRALPRIPCSLTVKQKLLTYHTKDENGCWLYLGAQKSKHGYTVIKQNGLGEGAHRWAYRLWVGQIPKDMKVLHTCGAGSCINPEHLFLATHLETLKWQGFYKTKLTTSDVETILRELDGGVSPKELAAICDVHQNVIYSIRSGHCWQDVCDDV